ncbi:hypothetical protein AXF42_Ash011514 [Apostasia shenzhenica]|uniref:Uncharacterized protein n=1 Tax=Apostasia shenzhenica TaxID=1088818 RepID=A0A2I0BAT3_9ASPA|nr:hypothetical protein AXF42_Ash011514 [Apostasia shenzhenica]
MRENPTLMIYLSLLVGKQGSNNLWSLRKDFFTVLIIINWVTLFSFVISNILSLNPKIRLLQTPTIPRKVKKRSPLSG